MLVCKMADDDVLLDSLDDQLSINPFDKICTSSITNDSALLDDKSCTRADKSLKTQRLVFRSGAEESFNVITHNDSVLRPLSFCNGYSSGDRSTSINSYSTRSPAETLNVGTNEEPEEENSHLLWAHSEESDSNEHCHSYKRIPFDSQARRQLILASILCLLFMIGEVIGGYLANSLAIMTDAAHMLSDFASFIISLFAMWIATRPATKRMSFGYYRAEIMGALISILIIWVLTGILVYMAAGRVISNDYRINAKAMLITSGCGVAVNIFMGIVLHGICNCHTHAHLGGHGHSHGGHGHSHGGHGHSHSDHGHSHSDHNLSVGREGHSSDSKKNKIRNINIRAAFIHVLGDLIQSLGVLLAAYIIHYKPEYKIADPICTFIFSILVLITTMTVLKDALVVLMEGFPKDLNYNQLKADLEDIEGVKMAHSIHAWSLTMDKFALTVHLATLSEVDSHVVLSTASRLLKKNYNIVNSTIQVERYQPAIMSKCNTCLGPQK